MNSNWLNALAVYVCKNLGPKVALKPVSTMLLIQRRTKLLCKMSSCLSWPEEQNAFDTLPLTFPCGI